MTFKYGHSPGLKCSLTVGSPISIVISSTLWTTVQDKWPVAWPALPSRSVMPVVATQVPVAGLLLLLTITGPGWRIHIVTVSSDHITSPLILMNVRMAPQYHTTASDDITILRGLSLTSSPRSGLAGTLQCNEN